MDATGVGAVSPTWDVNTLKGAFTPEDLLNLRGMDRLVNTSAKALIGHNRAATAGSAGNSHNAHPFIASGHLSTVMGAHNGTIDHYERKAIQVPDYKYKGQTDSEEIFAAIAEYGIEDTLGRIRGAWALSYVDQQEKTINLIRNGDRPLFYCMSESMKTMYWSSEYGLLAWILSRNAISIMNKEIYDVTPDTLMTWEIPAGVNAKFADVAGKQSKVAGKKYQVPAPYAGPHSYSGPSRAATGGDEEDGFPNDYDDGWDAFMAGRNRTGFAGTKESPRARAWKRGYDEAQNFSRSESKRPDTQPDETKKLSRHSLLNSLHASDGKSRPGFRGRTLSESDWNAMGITNCFETGKAVNFESWGFFMEEDIFVLDDLDNRHVPLPDKLIQVNDRNHRRSFSMGFENGARYSLSDDKKPQIAAMPASIKAGIDSIKTEYWKGHGRALAHCEGLKTRSSVRRLRENIRPIPKEDSDLHKLFPTPPSTSAQKLAEEINEKFNAGTLSKINQVRAATGKPPLDTDKLPPIQKVMDETEK